MNFLNLSKTQSNATSWTSKFRGKDELVTIESKERVEYDVFISYNQSIIDAVSKLHERLCVTGLTVWRDKDLEQIRQSKVFLCFLTQTYLESDNCRKELNYALKLKKQVVYLMIDQLCQEEIGIEFSFIENTKYTQCYKNPESWWKDNFNEIRDAIVYELDVSKIFIGYK